MATEGLNYGLYKNIKMLKILKKIFFTWLKFNSIHGCVVYDKTVFESIIMADGQSKNTLAPKGP